MHCSGLYLQTIQFFCPPNTSKSIKHKIEDCIQARHVWRWATFIMHEFCGLRTGNDDSLNWKQSFFKNDSESLNNLSRKIVKKSRFGTSYESLPFGWFGSKGMIECTTMYNDLSPKCRTLFETNSLCTLRQLGLGLSNMLRLAFTQSKPSSKALMKLGGPGTFLCNWDRMELKWYWKWQCT